MKWWRCCRAASSDSDSYTCETHAPIVLGRLPRLVVLAFDRQPFPSTPKSLSSNDDLDSYAEYDASTPLLMEKNPWESGITKSLNFRESDECETVEDETVEGKCGKDVREWIGRDGEERRLKEAQGEEDVVRRADECEANGGRRLEEARHEEWKANRGRRFKNEDGDRVGESRGDNAKAQRLDDSRGEDCEATGDDVQRLNESRTDKNDGMHRLAIDKTGKGAAARDFVISPVLKKHAGKLSEIGGFMLSNDVASLNGGGVQSPNEPRGMNGKLRRSKEKFVKGMNEVVLSSGVEVQNHAPSPPTMTHLATYSRLNWISMLSRSLGSDVDVGSPGWVFGPRSSPEV